MIVLVILAGLLVSGVVVNRLVRHHDDGMPRHHWKP